MSILIAPAESAALRLFHRDYYSSLAVTVRRGEELDVEVLTAHLASVGYTQMDLVEMPGQFTRRGGILDVYSPEADRPSASNSSAMKSRPSANSTPRRSALSPDSTRHSFCR